MFASHAQNLNTTYIQNNIYGSNNFGCNSGMGVPPMCCGSIFTAGMPYCNTSSLSLWGGPMSMPNMQYGGWYNPFGMMFGCGMNRFYNMLMSFRLLQSGMDSIINMFDTISGKNSKTSGTQFSFMPQIYSPAVYPTFSFSTVQPTVSKPNASTNQKVSKDFNINSNTNLPQLNDIGYNPDKGSKLAKAALSNARGFGGDCAMYVRFALEQTGLYNGMRGDGADYVNILSKNKNFKEISTNGLNLRSLPAGCILVYDRGVAKYSKTAGHVEITTGTGKAVSDGITNNIRPGAHVFVPV